MPALIRQTPALMMGSVRFSFYTFRFHLETNCALHCGFKLGVKWIFFVFGLIRSGFTPGFRDAKRDFNYSLIGPKSEVNFPPCNAIG